jgi:type III pantothenate kinase
MTSSAPYLLIDAGNSRIKWALVEANGTQLAAGALIHGDAAQPDWSNLPTPGSAWLSNVAGDSVAARVRALLDAHWPQLPLTTIRARVQQCGVTNRYTTADALGSDRWAGMIGAHAAFPGEHLLIATFGTATTLEALRADGCFIGGLIAPGWTLMMRSLGEHTAQLPTLDAAAARGLLDAGSGSDTARRGPFFATDTPRSLSAGCTLAQAGLIERSWRDLQDEWQVAVRLVVGGGAVDEVASALKVPHTRHDSLVLSGLALIAAEGATQHGIKRDA